MSAGPGTRDQGPGTADGCRPTPGPRPPAPGPFPGFSLVELIVSLAILGGGLLGAMYVFPVGLRASQRSELSSRAALVAQRTLESLKLLEWAQLPTAPTTEAVEDFTVTTAVHEPNAGGLVDPTRLKAVAVTVEWTQSGRTRALHVATYLRRPAQDS